MRKILLALSVLISSVAFGQSESNDMITYDTIMYIVPGDLSKGFWAAKITRPRNYFTPGNADTASRRVYLWILGAGEMVAGADTTTLKSKLFASGPHSIMQKTGWNGSVQTGSGTHYPIWITLTVNAQNIRPQYALPTFLNLHSKFHPRGGKIDAGGLSMGGWTLGRLFCYKAYSGDDRFMSILGTGGFFQGQANDLGTTFNIPGYGSFGYAAKKYGFKGFGLEGTGDSRQVWKVMQDMNDSLAGSGYFAFENIGGGLHCCWDEMLSPLRTNWTCVGSPLAPNIATNSGIPNTMGTYNANTGSYFQWVMKQGDTTLAGTTTTGPISNAGPDQNVTSTSASLNGSGSTCNSCSISSYAWSKLSGPTGGTISNTAIASPTISSLTNGTYVYQLTVSDGTKTSSDQVTIVKTSAGNTPPTVSAGIDRTITLPKDTISFAGSASDGDGSISSQTIIQTSGPSQATIANPSSLTTTITFPGPGTWIFRLTATDNGGASVSDEVTVTVNPQNESSPRTIYVRVGATTYKSNEWNNLSNPVNAVGVIDSKGQATGITVQMTNSGNLVDNGDKFVSFSGSLAQGLLWPDEVLRYTTNYSGPRTITIRGLNPSSAYNFYGLSARSSGNSQTTYNSNGISDVVTTLNNKTKTAILPTLTPDENGVLVIQVTTNNVSYVNGFILQEQGGTAPVDVVPTVTMPATPNPFTLPTSSTSLTATATDDYTAGLVYEWSVLSGPVGYSFSAPTSLTTNFSWSIAGTYELRFTATDTSGNTAQGRLTVTVSPAGNIPPVVSAGVDRSITIPLSSSTTSTTITGTATDDGTIVARLWEFISGPVGAILTNATTSQVAVSNLVEGAYSFRFSATDNSGVSRSDTMILTVTREVAGSPNKTLVGAGEYQAYIIDSLGQAYSIGNVTNAGTNNTGLPGVPKRLLGDAYNERFDLAVGGLHGGALRDKKKRIWVLGDNDKAQMGIGSFQHPIYYAQLIQTDSSGNVFNNIDTVSGGYLYIPNVVKSNYFVALKDGDPYIWGELYGGLAGNGTDDSVFATRPVKIQMPGGRKVKKIATGNTILFLCTDNTLWSLGRVTNYANLGYKPTNSATDYRTPHQVEVPTNNEIIDIAGGGAVNWAIYADGSIYAWGTYGNYMGDNTYATGSGLVYSVPRPVATTVSSAFPAKVKRVYVNYAATYFLLENGWLYAIGDNAQSAIGNGGSLDWKNTTPPYAWSAAPGQLLVKTPYRIAPGHTFKAVYTSNVYTFYAYFLETNDQLHVQGRGKGSVLANGITQASSSLASLRQNSIDIKWTTPVYPFSITTEYLASSPDCIDGTSTGSPCSSYTPPANTKPIANAGSSRTVTTNSFILNGTGSSDNVKIGWVEWKQVSGPSTALIDLPASFTPLVTVGADGVYVFRFVVEDNGRLKDSATVTITVAQDGNNAPTAAINGRASITLPINEVTLNGVGTDPDAGNTVTYRWRIVSGSGSLNSMSGSQVKVFGTTAGVTVVELVVIDNHGLESVPVLFVITTNPAPVANPQDPPKTLPGNGTICLGCGSIKKKFN